MTTPQDRVRQIIAEATTAPDLADLKTETNDPTWSDDELSGEPSDVVQDQVDNDVVAACAKLDQSDTDNGTRLIRHFGQDLLVLETEDVASADYIVWSGTHWNRTSGNDAAIRVAQKIGGRIAVEADHLQLTPPERALQAKADALKSRNPEGLMESERQIVIDAKDLPKALSNRRKARRAFGVSSKNQGRIINMLRMAAPHLARSPDAFNAAALVTAVRGHTLRFSQTRQPSTTAAIRVMQAKAATGIEQPFRPGDYDVSASMVATPGHDRKDLITKVMPVDYDPEATCPRWDAFLTEFLPDPAVRRCVQVFSGLGMTGAGPQKMMFHFGKGANGKSVFMETLMEISGPLGVGLPASSLVGDSKSSGQQASPDIARLYGARIVRVAELPADEPVKEELVKILTGGERMPARNLFKGFFEFTPYFKAHMSGNGYPRIDGTDNGIWRRIVVVPWTVTIPDSRQRELREVVREFVAEGSGILNWLIEGVLIFLREGFQVPEAAMAATKEYRDEMDPIGQFVVACVLEKPGNKVQARTMFKAYEAWSLANGKRPWTENKFGRVMKNKLKRDDSGSVHAYVDCILHNVPDRPLDAEQR